MYLPKNKFRIKYSNGGEFTNEDGTDFVGSYIETSGGKFIQGDSLENAGSEITPIEEERLLLDIDVPFNDYFGPTDEDYQRGFFSRYVIKNAFNGALKEVNRSRFLRFDKDPNYDGEEVVWYLSKPFEDTFQNGYIIQGSITKNSNTLLELESNFPGISRFFSPEDYLK